MESPIDAYRLTTVRVIEIFACIMFTTSSRVHDQLIG